MTMATTRTTSASHDTDFPVGLDAREVVHVGVDVHKATYHVALYSTTRGVVTTWVQPASPQALVDRLMPIRKRIAQVVYEAGPTGFGLARRLGAAQLPVHVIAPSRLLAPVGAEAKSDRLDCRKLAMHSAKGLLRPVRVPTAQEEADRQVLRLREQMVRKARATQQQIKSFLLQHGVAEPAGLAHWTKQAVEALRGLELLPELRFALDVLLDELGHAKQQVKRVTDRLGELAGAGRHAKAVDVMRTVPGVGPVTAMSFRLELPEPERFKRAGPVAKMLGLAPQVRQSGQTRREGGLLKSSSGRLRTVLVEAAWRWVGSDEAAEGHYRRLVANTGSSKKAIVGMARRLGVLLWRLSVHGQPYRVAS
jgi:transposase